MKIKIFGMVLVIMSSLYFVSCDKDVSVTPPEAPAPTGSFFIDSNPGGAEIILNNKATGRVTPDSLIYLGKGKYEIRLKLPFYRDSVFSIRLGQKEKVKLFVDFNENQDMKGSLLCQSKPGHAYVYLNGRKTNRRTPVTFKGLLPGAYTVAFKSAGCIDDSVKVVVKSSIKTNVSITLQDTTTWVTYNTSNSDLPTLNLTCCAVDGNGVLWIGTSDRGLVSFNGQEWRTYDPSNSNIPSYSIISLAVPNFDMYPNLKETIYIGTGNGLAVYSGGVITQYRKESSPLPDNHITSVSVDGGNYVWIGTEGGLALMLPNEWYDTNKWKIFNKSNSPLPENYITSLSAMPGLERHHEAWIGTAYSGVTYFNYVSKSWSSVSSSPGGAITSVAYSNYTGLWFGWAGNPSSPSGLMNINNNISASFPLTAPASIVPRPTATWVATSEGLYKKTTAGAWERLAKDNSGLPQNSIKDIAFDTNGNAFIITTNMGVVKYKVSQ